MPLASSAAGSTARAACPAPFGASVWTSAESCPPPEGLQDRAAHRGVPLDPVEREQRGAVLIVERAQFRTAVARRRASSRSRQVQQRQRRGGHQPPPPASRIPPADGARPRAPRAAQLAPPARAPAHHRLSAQLRYLSARATANTPLRLRPRRRPRDGALTDTSEVARRPSPRAPGGSRHRGHAEYLTERAAGRVGGPCRAQQDRAGARSLALASTNRAVLGRASCRTSRTLRAAAGRARVGVQQVSRAGVQLS